MRDIHVHSIVGAMISDTHTHTAIRNVNFKILNVASYASSSFLAFAHFYSTTKL